MYKTVVRAGVRRGLQAISAGDPSVLIKMATTTCELAFPGDNSWAAMCRPVVKGRLPHVTHRGIEECRAFADRFVAEGVQFEVEDILVNGPPWRTRVAVRAQTFVPSTQGPDRYNNRAVAFIELRWGRIVRWEDYEDCERVAEWDRSKGTVGAMP
jgi:ketosteroid isomerase-like protein